MKTIIADDDEITRFMLREILERAGHHVCAEASKGSEVLTLCKAHAPDVVFLDVNMPELNGFEALQLLRAARPGMGVVMITSSSTLDNVRQAAKMRVDGFIVKPFTPEKVLGSLKNFGPGVVVIR